MKRVLAALLSGVSLVSVAAYAQTADVPPWAADAKMNPDYKPGEVSAGYPKDSDAPAAAEAPAANAEPTAEAAPSTPAATPDATATKPDSAQPWAADAKMNPDYKPGEISAGYPKDSAADATDAPAAEQSTAQDDEAKRKADEEAAAAAAEETRKADEAAAAEAKRKADDEAAAAAAESKRKAEEETAAAAAAEAKRKAEEETAAAAKAAEETKRQQAIETCRDALNGEASAAKLQFATSKFDILQPSYKALDQLAKTAKDCGNVVIEVGGHTDNVGKSDANAELSKLRAEAVVKYLTKAGVDSSKLKAVGYGDAKPVASNDTPAGRQQNRRIEFLVHD